LFLEKDGSLSTNGNGIEEKSFNNGDGTKKYKEELL
jgi:hypothetical protein